MFQFRLPDIGEGTVEAELVKWHVREGDAVTENQVLAEMMTDKASIEIPSPRTGRVARLGFEEGATVAVGEVLIEIAEAGGEAEAPAPDSSAEDRAAPPAERQTPPAEPRARPAEQQAPPAAAPLEPAPRPDAPSGNERNPPPLPPRPHRPAESAAADPDAREEVRAVPAVRELAQKLGVDLAQVDGTGPRGRILRRDVERHATTLPHDGAAAAGAPGGAGTPARDADPDDWRREPLRGLRRIIASRMHESKTQAAHFTYVEEIDMTAVERLRHARGERDQQPLSPLVFIAHALVRVLRRYPALNASLDAAREEIVLKQRIHLGVATATEKGLVVPVIRDADRLSLAELGRAIGELAAAARDKRLKPELLSGSTFTVTSLGKLGGVMATPVLNYPETAIVAPGAIRTLPRYVEGELEPRAIMNLSMSLDHRLVDGIDCARFVHEVKRILERADFPDLSTHKPEE